MKCPITDLLQAGNLPLPLVRTDLQNRRGRKYDIWQYGSDDSPAKTEPCSGLPLDQHPTCSFFLPYIEEYGKLLCSKIPCFLQFPWAGMHPKLTFELGEHTQLHK